jgi:ubiquinone/menaquinone biosynthesis C-methylase UbiE
VKHGDFTALAKEYIHRPGYSHAVLLLLMDAIRAQRSDFAVADIGAGTGKLTEDLLALGAKKITAVEPNDAMRAEGIKTTGRRVEWQKGTGEETGLSMASADWLLMASSFHWVDASRGLPEFHRVLRPGGRFTALWNPRDLERSDLMMRIETRIREIVPGLTRVSSGGGKYTEGMYEKLVSTGHFEDVVFVEAQHEVRMEPERYIGAWRSVNDIQVQAGRKWPAVLEAIESAITGLETVVVPYKTRSWTARRRS